MSDSPQHQSNSPQSSGPGTGVVATVLILLVGLIALQVMSLQQSSEALTSTHSAQQELTALIQARTERALIASQEALVAAGAARPDPYTGADAREDEYHRKEQRRIEHAHLLSEMDHKLALVEAKTDLKISSLEIPPASVRNLLASLTAQAIRNEKAVLILSLALDHISPESSHAETLSLLQGNSAMVQ
jgi:cell division protein FtsN